MFSDLKFAIRQLVKNPGFTAIAVLSLALGIGATTAVFSIINGTLLQPAPYRQPDELAFVTVEKLDGAPVNDSATGAQFATWKQARSFSGLAAYHWTFNFLIEDDGNESLEGLVGSADLFTVLGLQPHLGRAFTDEEKQVQQNPVIVIGHNLWQRQFAADPDIVGKVIRLSRLPPLKVIGVMPAGVRFLPSRGAAQEPNYNLHAPVDYWIPGTPDAANNNARVWSVVARLAPRTGVQHAQAEMTKLALTQAQTDPALAGMTATVTPIDDVLGGDIRRVVLPLFGAVCFVLLIAGANVAGLLLVRGLSRQRELAVRAAPDAGLRIIACSACWSPAKWR